MRRVLRSLWLCLCLATTLAAPLAAAYPPRQRLTAPPAQLPTVRVAFSSEPLSLRESVRSEGTFLRWETALPLDGVPGAPALPRQSKLVAVPSRDLPQPVIQLGEAQPLPKLALPLEPMPTLEGVDTTGDLSPDELVKHYRVDEALYARDGWFPASPVTLGEPMTLRGQTVVQVVFTPVQVNLATGEARWFPAADVALEWPAEALASVTAVEDPHYESFLAATLDNYEQGRAWRTPPQDAATRLAGAAGPSWMIRVSGKGLYRIPFSQLAAAGVDVSNPARLALFHGPTDPALQQEQAIWIDAGALYFINVREPTRWSVQTAYRLEQLPSGTGKRMAELPAPPTQPTTVTSVPYTQRFEQNHTYESSAAVAGATDRWYWKRLFVDQHDREDSLSTSFSLPYLVADHPSPATIEVAAAPLSNGCHYARLSINGVQRAARGGPPCSLWSDTSPFGQTATVPHNQLLATGNQFTFEQRYLEGAPDSLMLNSFTVRYQRTLTTHTGGLLFDGSYSSGTNFRVAGLVQLFLPISINGVQPAGVVNDAAPPPHAFTMAPGTPNTGATDFLAFEVGQLAATGEAAHLTGVTSNGASFTFGRSAPSGERYLVARRDQAQAVQSITPYQDAGLRSPTQADYLLITHPSFASAVQPLAAHRSAEGLAVRVVTTEQIYNDFGSGVMDPGAIRAFLQYAYRRWSGPAPTYVLLVGDATYDPLGYSGSSKRVWVPPWMYDGDLTIGEAPADNGFVNALQERGDPAVDPVPDMHIGRLPVNSAAEASAMVQKIIAYETSAPPSNRVLLTTDDQPSLTQCDPAGCFYQLSDRPVNDLFPSSIQTIKAYLRHPGMPYDTYQSVRDKIAAEMNAGLAIVQYIGHASRTQWATPAIWSVRRPGDTSDLSLLQPNPRQPLVLPWTCWEGYFIHPSEDSLSEQMVRLPDRGAIASFAPTGLDVATGHDYLTRGLYDAMFDRATNQVTETELGALTVAAKMKLALDPDHPENSPYKRLFYTYLLLGDPALNLKIQ